MVESINQTQVLATLPDNGLVELNGTFPDYTGNGVILFGAPNHEITMEFSQNGMTTIAFGGRNLDTNGTCSATFAK